jgi:hemerythrin-like domain-containing protein
MMKSATYDVVNEHQRIHKLVDRLDDSLERRLDDGSAWLASLNAQLDELNRALGHHFHGEETEVFSDIQQRLPRFADLVDRLVREHRQMEQLFAQAGDRAKQLTMSAGAEPDALVEQIADALQVLRAHEEQENELMLMSFWQDLGEAD